MNKIHVPEAAIDQYDAKDGSNRFMPDEPEVQAAPFVNEDALYEEYLCGGDDSES